MTRFPSQRTTGRPPVIHRRPGPTQHPVPSARQLWLAGADPVERARDVARATDVGRQLLADEPAWCRRLAARVDWGMLHAGFWVLVLAVLTALVLTGGIR